VTSPFEELCSPDPFRELESRPVPKNDDRSGLYQRTFAQLSHGIRDRGIGVGRIQNDKIVGSAFAVEIALHRLAVDRALGRKLRAFQVFANDRRGRSSHFHKIDVGGAARKRLDANGAGTGIEIEHPMGSTPSEPSAEKTACRILSDIGRVPLVGGPLRLRPLAEPVVTRIGSRS